jgi:hypothetical protein
MVLVKIILKYFLGIHYTHNNLWKWEGEKNIYII